ncbi:MAG: hypothetical protein AAFU79_25470, partial [Myxococcota bacterium]
MFRKRYLLYAALACSSCGDDANDPGVADDAGILPDAGAVVDAGTDTDAGAEADAGAGSDAGAEADAGAAADGGVTPAECESTVAAFMTLGSANPNLAEPFVSATCDGTTVVVSSNSIPDFPYVQTSPGDPREFLNDYSFPLVPTVAAEPSEVPRLGALGVAVNGIPIFGQAEGTGGDVVK